MTSLNPVVSVSGSHWPTVLFLGVVYFAVIQAAFYLSSFTTLATVAFVPVLFETVTSSPTQLGPDHFALAGVFFGLLSVCLAFGVGVVRKQPATLAVTVGFAVLTWLIVGRQAFGEDAVWYYLVATPVVGAASAVLLWIGQ